MIYLKFDGQQSGPLQQRVHCTDTYSTALDDKGLRVYYKPGMWERLSPTEWLSCFVMSETGKTIDKIEAPVDIPSTSEDTESVWPPSAA